MSAKKELVVEIPSPGQKRKVKLDLVKSGVRVWWSSGNRDFQQAFRIDLQTGVPWISQIHVKDSETGEKRRKDVGIPVWVFKFVLSYELDDLMKAVEREGQ